MKNGSAELAQLADLLRLGAQAARQVAKVRPDDVKAIERLALEAERMADDLDSLLDGADRKARAIGQVH